MANNINTMQIWCYINYHWNNTKIKSIQCKLFQCLFYMNKALNLGHLVKVLWKHLNSTNTKGSPLCDVLHWSYVSKCNQYRSKFEIHLKVVDPQQRCNLILEFIINLCMDERIILIFYLNVVSKFKLYGNPLV